MWTRAEAGTTLTVTLQDGKEGFLVAFGVKDTSNWHWWNIGGWNNTRTAVEQAVDGGKSTLISKPGSVDTGRAYAIDIKVRGRQVTLCLDGQQWGGFTDDKPAEPFRQVVTRDARTRELIVKVVNDQSSAARTAIDLTGVADRFTYTFPANSITFLRIRQR